MGACQMAIVAALAAALSSAAVAAPAVVNPGDAVPGHPGLTYLELVRQAVPSLATNAADNQIEGSFATVPRDLAGKTYEGEEPDPLVLGFMEDQRIQVGGKPRIALIADLGPEPDRIQSATLLLLYDDAPTPKLLDVAGVSVDQDTEFADQAAVKVGPGDDALVAYSEHDDADLTMGGYLLISAEGDRLALVDQVRITSTKACGWNEIETPTFTGVPEAGRAIGRIDLAIRAEFTRTDDDCGAGDIPRVRTHTFHTTYRWNAARRRFEAQGDGVRQLDALNEVVFH